MENVLFAASYESTSNIHPPHPAEWYMWMTASEGCAHFCGRVPRSPVVTVLHEHVHVCQKGRLRLVL